MVLLSAAVCNKSGKAIISRQFVEMTRSRIEGLLAAFPKLMGSGKQHTFVETESVRYVYQPLEKLYMLLITTKASNILEDLETLRLFARVIPEYCKNMEESEIVENAFSLIFAFDEIVALGYRESVNLAQIRTFTEMDSHEEKVFQAVRQTQEREAKENMKRRAKELQQQRREAQRSGRGGSGYSGGFGSSGNMGSMGSSGGMGRDTQVIETTVEPSKPSRAPTKPIGGRGMKIRSKAKDEDSFVTKLESEGQHVVSATSSSKPSAVAKSATPAINQESVHIRCEEKINLTAGRDGGLQNLEILGLITLKVTDDKYGHIHIGITNNDDKGMQLQTHPNVDKKMFASNSVIATKNPSKPFPTNIDIGVLKWRFQTQDDAFMPLSINCWPNETNKGCDVNIEYELEKEDMELNDVVISIPVPSGVGAPVVSECEGEYHYNNRKNILEWNLPLIDSSNKTGSMEFSINGHPDDFFPVTVSFVSKRLYCDIELNEVKMASDDSPVKFSSEVIFFVDKYEIV